ncbi:sensor histidine kinase [Luteipulveratus mongoliensis]|uniref:histidine kinase n=1 Tax=Luteipulveratus mongoliensis TaxID=571913 RepID=A0A0K1JPB5_9MICO|nr:sensor histidine kinase [Luteipulveratus mongoliensis]AKU18428.1 hypothetical protein VV02_25545 [Luteipulveratus mongoliensis]
MDGQRVMSWVATYLYAAVLAAGVYEVAAGLRDAAPLRVAGFVAVLVTLVALEAIERGTPIGRAGTLTLLATRIGLIAAAVPLDSSDNARILLVLMPFYAFLTLGRRTGIALAIALTVVVVALVVRRPEWWRDSESVSDLLMFTIGNAFAVAMATVAARAQARQASAEQLLAEVSSAHAQLRSYAEEAAALATVAERTRLARDIHDGLGHHLTAIAIQLEKSQRYRDIEPALAERALEDARTSAAQALDDVRRSVRALRSEGWSLQLEPALRRLADGVADDDLAVTVSVTGSPGDLGERSLIALYHAAQEGLTNVRRHAQAATVQVRAVFGPSEGSVEIADDGRGFDILRSPDGYGLTGMRERLDAVGGVLTINAGPGGTTVTATVPRNPS